MAKDEIVDFFKGRYVTAEGKPVEDYQDRKSAALVGIEKVEISSNAGELNVILTDDPQLSAESVSYTHLDVYKRQTRTWYFSQSMHSVNPSRLIFSSSTMSNLYILFHHLRNRKNHLQASAWVVLEAHSILFSETQLYSLIDVFQSDSKAVRRCFEGCDLFEILRA